MKLHYARSAWARAFAGATLVASVVGSAGLASASAVCTFAFPHGDLFCASGSSIATVNHAQIQTRQGRFRFEMTVNMRGGTLGAAAYGIDVNGNHLNSCATIVADDDPTSIRSGVPCSQLIVGGTGEVPFTRQYDHAVNMASTFVAVN